MCANAVSKVNKYSCAQMCCLAVFSVKLTYIANPLVKLLKKLPLKSAHLFCEFSLEWIFCNVVRTILRLLVVIFLVTSIQPGRLASALCPWMSILMNPLDHCFSCGQGKTVSAHWYCLSLYCCYDSTRNSVAYCCRDFVVNRQKALLTNCLALLCYDSWIRRLGDILFFQSAEIEGGFWLVALTKMVPLMVSVVHFKTTFWVNHWCEKYG